MSTFSVDVRKIESIENHPYADNLEIANLEGTNFQSCVQIGEFKESELVAHIPPDSLVPEELQEEMGVKGYLAGPDNNRVKSVKLRGKLSQGLLYPAREHWQEGDDVQDELGIEKYQPPIPTQMNGQVWPAPREACIKYDIENYKKYPNVIKEGEEVVYTEKVHGTFSQMGLVEEEYVNHELGNEFVVGSKGLLKKRQPFQIGTKYAKENNQNNLYLRAAEVHDVKEKLEGIRNELRWDNIFLLGEVFGKKVQDLHYGKDPTKNDIGFQVFDVYVGPYMNGEYLPWQDVEYICEKYDLKHVPVLYKGEHTEEKMEKHMSGHETISGDKKHIREGIIIRPTAERTNEKIGRAILKAKSEAYLTRGEGTEYH